MLILDKNIYASEYQENWKNFFSIYSISFQMRLGVMIGVPGVHVLVLVESGYVYDNDNVMS